MKRCQIQKGFFVLKNCGDVAVAQCKNCQKSICKNHNQTYLQKLKDKKENPTQNLTQSIEIDPKEAQLCVSCYVIENKERLEKDNQNNTIIYQNDPLSDALWYFSMRDSFYHNNHYTPFNDYDTNDFNVVRDNDINDSSDDNTTFFDS